MPHWDRAQKRQRVQASEQTVEGEGGEEVTALRVKAARPRDDDSSGDDAMMSAVWGRRFQTPKGKKDLLVDEDDAQMMVTSGASWCMSESAINRNALGRSACQAKPANASRTEAARSAGALYSINTVAFHPSVLDLKRRPARLQNARPSQARQGQKVALNPII